MSAFHPPTALSKRAALLLKRHVLSEKIPWDKQRSRMAAALMATHVPKGVERTRIKISGVGVEALHRTDGSETGTLLQVHGGGFCVGSPVVSRGWAGALCARLGLRVLSVDYRLAPEHPFPAAVDDVDVVLSEVLEEMDAEQLVLSGDSAGANLALGAVQRRVAAGRSTPAGLVLLSPWLDLSDDRLGDPLLSSADPMLSPSWLSACAEAYAPEKLADPRVSPLLGSLEGLPPLMVQGGSDDVLAPDAARLVAALPNGSDVTYSVASGLWHDFSLQVGTLEAADIALAVTSDFLSRVLGLGPKGEEFS
jgi:acetyl esterase/lipase